MHSSGRTLADGLVRADHAHLDEPPFICFFPKTGQISGSTVHSFSEPSSHRNTCHETWLLRNDHDYKPSFSIKMQFILYI